MISLDLFPLHAVLFPGEKIPLRVFEPRYLSMIRDCYTEGREFGVIMIKEGSETGPPPIPESVGTSARMVAVREVGESELMVVVEGTRRFQIDYLLQEQPHIRAAVEWIDDEAGPLYSGDEERLGKAIRWLLESLPGPYRELSDQLEVPEETSGAVGLGAALLPVGPEQKHQLLVSEPISVMDRMSEIIEAFCERAEQK